ncbi:hypothetical protein EDC02_7091 [Micromonospora sp. Llam0]|nr:hypothetical protein EDC02_7091 [Micromonospora sp. Llam0]
MTSGNYVIRTAAVGQRFSARVSDAVAVTAQRFGLPIRLVRHVSDGGEGKAAEGTARQSLPRRVADGRVVD